MTPMRAGSLSGKAVVLAFLLLAASSTVFLASAAAETLGVVRDPQGGLFCHGPCGPNQACCDNATPPPIR